MYKILIFSIVYNNIKLILSFKKNNEKIGTVCKVFIKMWRNLFDNN